MQTQINLIEKDHLGIFFNQGMLFLGSDHFLFDVPLDVRVKNLLTIASVTQETSDT